MNSRLTKLTAKIMDVETLQSRLTETETARKIVFTNGCFDILHVGHVTYLAQAADLGDFLVIGLNTDQSVRRQGKGDDRPVNKEMDRALLLAALEFVDAVILFDGDTPYNLIAAIQPDVLVKGGDYDPNETNPSAKNYIVGSDIVKAKGGSVQIISFVDGYSTTSTLARIRQQNG